VDIGEADAATATGVLGRAVPDGGFPSGAAGAEWSHCAVVCGLGRIVEAVWTAATRSPGREGQPARDA